MRRCVVVCVLIVTYLMSILSYSIAGSVTENDMKDGNNCENSGNSNESSDTPKIKQIKKRKEEEHKLIYLTGQVKTMKGLINSYGEQRSLVLS
mmetsp:Transcript_4924/g.8767  ORF Transcript_4924/g.8767 Transcript_4924/m.8767 type:complete len:93 (+) Transcript_4924:266-544(+)|eukprot:CAMPEP_0178781444 /NCGR_PEP_ID=MMETSP0745-20121128/2605_1 /TAXON_ID=913974 /ORGANISM="Nitzschia punctata, Strain CCMP561" /LENGTH=92 /DNA_ID=CAMNT_0020438789 /DNA_START=223 /DNA_END=501 /DNA_ORIENTATION=+